MILCSTQGTARTLGKFLNIAHTNTSQELGLD